VAQFAMPSQVFISYAHEDLSKVKLLYRALRDRGVDVWFDRIHLGPGEWVTQIRRAITRSRYFILCLSASALRKTGDTPGFQDSELNEAYYIATRLPPNVFTIIPVRLENCGRGDNRISAYQQYDLFDDWEGGVDRLATALGGAMVAPGRIDDTDGTRLLDGLRLRSAALYAANDLDAAMKIQDAIETIEGPTAENLTNRADILAAKQQLGESISAYEQALHLDRRNIRALHNKGVALARTGERKEAIAHFELVIAADPSIPEAWYNKGLSLAENDHAAALESYRMAVQLAPKYAAAWNSMGVSLDMLGRKEEALSAYDESLKYDDADWGVWGNRANVLRDIGRDDESRESFQRMARLLGIGDAPLGLGSD
jgi:tetratricopeptide (TPR) repeat protein